MSLVELQLQLQVGKFHSYKCSFSNLLSTTQMTIKTPWNTPEDIPDPPESGDVSVVLLQHWANMITDLRNRADHASEAARIAQHQVHVLSRELTRVRGDLILRQGENDNIRQHVRTITNFTTSAIMWVPNVSQNHFLVKEYNQIINDYNRDHEVLDLTTETESDSE